MFKTLNLAKFWILIKFKISTISELKLRFWHLLMQFWRVWLSFLTSKFTELGFSGKNSQSRISNPGKIFDHRPTQKSTFQKYRFDQNQTQKWNLQWLTVAIDIILYLYAFVVENGLSIIARGVIVLILLHDINT